MPTKIPAFLVLFCVLLLALTSATNATSIYIDNIGGFDATLINSVRPYLSAWIGSMGCQLTNLRANADYLVRLSIVDVDAARPFNWWVLLFPLWPIIPITTVEADVVVSMTILDSSGREVYSNTAGGDASAFLAADFFSRKWAKKSAFDQAFRRLVVSVYLP